MAGADRHEIYIGDTGSKRKAETRRLLAFVLVVAAAALVAGATGRLPIHVRVDGRPAWVARGTTVSDLIDEGLITTERGDLYSVSGRLVGLGEGCLPLVEMDGRSAREDEVVAPASEIVSRPGPDATETIVHRVVETTAPVRFIGRGPVEHLVASGCTGKIFVSRGERSGIELTRTVAADAVPAVVRRERPAVRGRVVALTFDDGPWPRHTDAVLAVLKREKAKATFFMIGDLVRKRPDTARRVVAAGMEIGTHSMTHRRAVVPSKAYSMREVDMGIDTIDAVLGVHPVWFRPPAGYADSWAFGEASRRRVNVAGWTIDPSDYRRPGSWTITRRVVEEVRPGSVVLLHDGGGDRSQTVKALRSIIRKLKKKGYRFVTLSELCGVRPAVASTRP